MSPMRFSEDDDRSPADVSRSEPCLVSASSERLEVRVLDVDGDVVVAVSGEIDPTTAGLFRTGLEQAFARARRVVVDLSGVTFIDSTGINALISSHQAVRSPGALVLRSPRPSTLRLLELTGLDQIMSIEGDQPNTRSTPPEMVTSDVIFDIDNRNAGRVIDVTMRQPVTAATWPSTEGRLLKLIAVRQPAELHIELGTARPPDGFASYLDKIGSALTNLGGTLTVSPPIELTDPGR